MGSVAINLTVDGIDCGSHTIVSTTDPKHQYLLDHLVAERMTLGEVGREMGFTTEVAPSLAPPATVFDFEDGNGPVPAHQHKNGGGWVANTARVAETVFVGPEARVYGQARVYGKAWVFGKAQVYGNAQVSDLAWVYDLARVCGQTQVCGRDIIW